MRPSSDFVGDITQAPYSTPLIHATTQAHDYGSLLPYREMAIVWVEHGILHRMKWNNARQLSAVLFVMQIGAAWNRGRTGLSLPHGRLSHSVGQPFSGKGYTIIAATGQTI